MFKKPSRFSLGFINTSIIIALLGLAVNAANSYVNILLNRTRMATEQIHVLTRWYADIDTRDSRNCITYAKSTFNNDEMKSLWDNNDENFKIEALRVVGEQSAADLMGCLSTFRGIDANAQLQSILQRSNDKVFMSRVSYHIYRQIFNFFNAHDTVLNTWKKNKADYEVFCDQMSPKFLNEYIKPFVVRSNLALHGSEAKYDSVSKVYPSVTWYINNSGHICNRDWRFHIRNRIEFGVPGLYLLL